MAAASPATGALEGRAAIVTGGTGALGRQVTRLFLDAGADVTVTYRDPGERDALAALLPDHLRERLHAAAADVTEAASVRDLVASVTARAGRLIARSGSAIRMAISSCSQAPTASRHGRIRASANALRRHPARESEPGRPVESADLWQLDHLDTAPATVGA